MELITRVLSLKYHKYVTDENNCLFKSKSLKTTLSGLLSEMSGAESTKLFKIAWFYLFRRVTASVNEFNRREIQFVW